MSRGVISGDVNRDGRPDLVVANINTPNGNDGTIAVLLNASQ